MGIAGSACKISASSCTGGASGWCECESDVRRSASAGDVGRELSLVLMRELRRFGINTAGTSVLDRGEAAVAKVEDEGVEACP